MFSDCSWLCKSIFTAYYEGDRATIVLPAPFSPHSSCLFKKSYNTKVVKFHHRGTEISSCGARPRPRRHWALSYKNMSMKCLIHKAFEAFLKWIAMGDSGSENYLLRVFFLSFFLLLCLQQEQPQQLYGNFDMEIFRIVMTMKLLQSSEIRILGVFHRLDSHHITMLWCTQYFCKVMKHYWLSLPFYFSETEREISLSEVAGQNTVLPPCLFCLSLSFTTSKWNLFLSKAFIQSIKDKIPLVCGM